LNITRLFFKDGGIEIGILDKKLFSSCVYLIWIQHHVPNAILKDIKHVFDTDSFNDKFNKNYNFFN